jgi:hypothetical protein
MEWLNDHYPLYFWTIVQAGNIQQAAAELKVSVPAMSIADQAFNSEKSYLRALGGQLVLIDTCKTVFSNTENIYTLGRELMDVVKNRPATEDGCPQVHRMCDTARRQLLGEGKSFSKLPVSLVEQGIERMEVRRQGANSRVLTRW